MDWVIPKKLVAAQLVNKINYFYVTYKFSTAFVSVCNWNIYRSKNNLVSTHTHTGYFLNIYLSITFFYADVS
jgi:hypothetical protein